MGATGGLRVGDDCCFRDPAKAKQDGYSEDAVLRIVEIGPGFAGNRFGSTQIHRHAKEANIFLEDTNATSEMLLVEYNGREFYHYALNFCKYEPPLPTEID